MLCANLVCMWLMFNTLKVAQAEKQIYPERFGKLSNFHTSPGAGTGEVAGARAPCGAVITKKTAGRRSAAPKRAGKGMGSPTTNQPRESAQTRITKRTAAEPTAVV